MSLLIIGLCGQSVFLTVPHFHRPEETLHADSFFCEPGGKGYNQAVAAARMGAKVAFAGAVGWDADGDACAARLEQEGIAPHMVRKAQRTAYAAILTDASGENRVTVFAGARLSAEDIRGMKPQFEAARMLLITPEIPQDAFAQAVAMAKENGVRIVINPAPFFPWVRAYLADAWLLTPNRSEACTLLDCGEEALMERMKAADCPQMVVTLGAQGAACVSEGKVMMIPAAPANVVDTTGAGDCFSGALCALLLEGIPLEQAAKMAVCAASLSVEHAHVLDGMPHRKKLESDEDRQTNNPSYRDER
ncbi:MAG: ribokinase [Clostridia bacterium]|nr:ribokinase [Clostridia bacterium]